MVSKSRLGALLAAAGIAGAGLVAAPGSAKAWWGGGWGGVRVGIALPPVVVAPPPVYAAPPVAYAPPVYAPPPAYYYAPPRRVWVPAHWRGGYWVPGHWA